MIIGLGTDIVEIQRIAKSIFQFGDKFLEKIFTESEIEYCNSKKNSTQHFAGRFAAKEAIVKAMASCCERGFNWHDMEIYNLSSGEPKVRFYGKFADFISADKEKEIKINVQTRTSEPPNNDNNVAHPSADGASSVCDINKVSHLSADEALSDKELKISISHSENYATAVAILYKNN